MMRWFAGPKEGREGAKLWPAGLLALQLLTACSPERERQFIPGPLGHVAGGAGPAGPTAAAYLSRSLYGLDRPEEKAWGVHNGLTPAFAFGHHLGRVFPPELFAAHPEYFPLVDGRRLAPPAGSYFWNPDLGRPDVAVHAARQAADYFQREPGAESFALGVNDGLTFGDSPETRAWVTPPRWFRERPDYAPLVFTFMNRAAEELGRTHPGKFLGCLAYYWCENTPGFPVHPQVVPFLTADRAQGYDPAFARGERLLRSRWAAAGPKRLGLYDYLFGRGYLIPRIHTRLLAAELRSARRAGFTDYFAQLEPNWGLDGPMPWLAAQLLLDPAQPEADLLEEYYRRYFGRAAGPMRRFFGRCEEQWMGQEGPAYWLKHYRSDSQARLFPAAVCAELRGILGEAGRSAADPAERARVRLVSAAFGVTERFVRFAELREAVARGALGGTGDWRGLLRDVARLDRARGDFIGWTVRLRHEAPLAVASFLWSDYLRDDPAPAALGRVHALAVAAGEAGAATIAARASLPERLAPLWRQIAGAEGGPGPNLLAAAAFDGPPVPGRRMADLAYGVDLPAGWISKVEPGEFHRAELRGESDRRLHVAGARATAVYQWVRVGPPQWQTADVLVRGRVSAASTVALTFAWLDSAQRHLRLHTHRLPAGDWPDWVSLSITAEIPPGAVFAGVGLSVQDQARDDWVEAKSFALRNLPIR